MVNLIKELNQFYNGGTIDEALATKLQEVVKKESEKRPIRKNYYGVTEITNPAQAYWSYINPITSTARVPLA